MSSYRDLEVYRKAHELGVRIHRLSLKLPKYELYETGSQLRRAGKSISSNLVEGYGRRRYKAEFERFIIFALASADETTEWLQYIEDCHADLAPEANGLRTATEETGRQINRFLEAVVQQHRSEK